MAIVNKSGSDHIKTAADIIEQELIYKFKSAKTVGGSVRAAEVWTDPKWSPHNIKSLFIYKQGVHVTMYTLTEAKATTTIRFSGADIDSREFWQDALKPLCSLKKGVSADVTNVMDIVICVGGTLGVPLSVLDAKQLMGISFLEQRAAANSKFIMPCISFVQGYESPSDYVEDVRVAKNTLSEEWRKHIQRVTEGKQSISMAYVDGQGWVIDPRVPDDQKTTFDISNESARSKLMSVMSVSTALIATKNEHYISSGTAISNLGLTRDGKLETAELFTKFYLNTGDYQYDTVLGKVIRETYKKAYTVCSLYLPMQEDYSKSFKALVEYAKKSSAELIDYVGKEAFKRGEILKYVCSACFDASEIDIIKKALGHFGVIPAKGRIDPSFDWRRAVKLGITLAFTYSETCEVLCCLHRCISDISVKPYAPVLTYGLSISNAGGRLVDETTLPYVQKAIIPLLQKEMHHPDLTEDDKKDWLEVAVVFMFTEMNLFKKVSGADVRQFYQSRFGGGENG